MPAALRPADPRPRRLRTLALALAAALAALLALAGGASADLLTPESGGSANADAIDTLYKIVMYVALVVFLGVEGVLLYCVFRFKARKGEVAAQIRGNTRLEIGWTVGAAVVLVVLAIVTFVQLDDIRNPPDSDPDGFRVPEAATVQFASGEQRLPPSGESLNIIVNGQQYVWRYTYPDDDTNVLNNAFAYTEMVVPTKTTVTLQIEAQDVVHSWWIPELGGKADAVPGHTNYTWFKIPEPGVYGGQCAELCGRGHANMVAKVRAVPPAEFERWLAGKQRQIARANAAAQEARQEIETEQSQGDEAP